MVFRSLGLKRPVIDPEIAGQIPPGQFRTERWPVLHQGAPPHFDPATWDFSVTGLVENPVRLTWHQFVHLPRKTIQADMHCVTRWSKLDNAWEGVPLRAVLEAARPRPAARFALIGCDGGYSTNLPFAALTEDDVLLALRHDGEELSPDHGFPVRLVVPQRYAWKSAKWVRSIELTADDRPGYWERYGYHGNGDPWREERFAE